MSETKNWYRVEMVNGEESYCFFGSSELTESAFIEKLNKKEYIKLENLIYFNDDQDPRSWSDWDPMLEPRIYLNPEFVITMLPLTGDPRRRTDSEAKILNLPGSLPPED